MTGEDGQALVLSVLILALAAVSMLGLRAAQDRLVESVRVDRAGEAAVEAAGSVVADYLVTMTPAVVIGDPSVLAAVDAAANRVALANGDATPTSVRLLLTNGGVEAALVLAGRPHRASVPLVSCCRR